MATKIVVALLVGSVFNATNRSSLVSRALYTTPFRPRQVSRRF